MKRLFSHQNKEEEKEKNIIENLNMLKEIALQTFWNFDAFPFILCYRLKTAFLIGSFVITFACIAVWVLPTC